MGAIKRWIINRKLMYKLIAIYICIGTIPIVILGLFAYRQHDKTIQKTELESASDVASQSISSFNNKITKYDNLSDYIAFNGIISNVLSEDYTSKYKMYQQYSDNIDPVLSSVRYFNADVKRITIYVDKEIVKHDTTVASLSEIRDCAWYKKMNPGIENTWYIDKNEQKVYCARVMPIMAQNGKNAILFLELGYHDLFGTFDSELNKNYGVFLYDNKDSLVYEAAKFSTEKRKYELTEEEFISEKKKNDGKYSIISKKIDLLNGLEINYYEINENYFKKTQELIGFGIVLLVIGIAVSILAAVAFSKVVVKDIKALQKNMEMVKKGDMTVTVRREDKDELGDLISGFGSMVNHLNHLINEVYEGKLIQKKYEMRALQAQINPHFLYNSLSLINWKALESGKDDISKITLALSSFYRTSLNRGNNIITIEKEIENMNSYLEIQSCMHDNSFDVIVDIDENIYKYEMLNLILQPIVENSIEHGIDLLEDRKGFIKIIGRQDDENIYLFIEDNGIGMEKEVLKELLEFETTGYGVRNVNARIKLYYGDEYQLQFESEVNVGTKCKIVIPKNL